ncbi:MAG: hypothetical protein MMC23_008034 [Stictis urceolatum]|nr:hypothetical protein [Stictis urceolata]
MAPSLEISIPTTTIAPSPKPHTVYHITLRLPLRTFTLQKRYSDFTSLHTLLTTQSGSSPPTTLPPKNYFSSTLHNPALTEKRRAGLETYLRTISSHADFRWRETSAWRSFLNLPSSLAGKSSAADSLHSALTSSYSGPNGAVSDLVAWLDTHRELKQHLHSARSTLAARDAGKAEANAAETHDASAAAKKELVRASTLLGALEKGLRENGAEWGAKKLGEGEVRRRRDLISAARREVEGLEGLVALVRRKGDVDTVVEDIQGGGAKVALVGGERKGVGKGRVLGKETGRTRELDNSGVVQLQQQMMREQDEDVDMLAQAVRRQRELGEQIQQELELQNEMMGMLEDDVDRVGGKLKVARKRVDKIS